MKFYQLNRQKYAEQLHLRYNLKMINRTADVLTLIILLIVGFVIYALNLYS